jgi:ubiquinone/menaquinone biosynthesis C-methylase UbiE
MIPLEIQQAMYGFMSSHVLFVGDELGIFDLLAQDNWYTSEEIAKNTDVQAFSLERLLLASVAIGIVKKQVDKYQVSEHIKPFLAKTSPNYCGGAFTHFREISTQSFRFLKNAVQENQPQWKHVFGQEGNYSPFTDLYKDPEVVDNFLSSMWGLGYPAAQELVKKYSFNKHSCLVDVGGGSGSFVIAALEQCLTLHAIVFDLPSVQSYLEKKRSQHQLDKRLNFVAGDFFKDDLPIGDLYVLGYILSDWNRQDGTYLLNKIYDSLPNGGTVMILEKLFNEDKNGPIETAMMNLAMLLETRGQHYSESEYISWLQEVGFCNCKVIRSSGEKHLVVGIKP